MNNKTIIDIIDNLAHDHHNYNVLDPTLICVEKKCSQHQNAL